MKANVAYRLLSLEFRGTNRRMMFNGAFMIHRGNTVVIDGKKDFGGRVVTPAKRRAYLDDIGDREIKTIHYQIIATDPSTGKRLHPPVTFCHPVPRGTHVHLADLDGDKTVISRDGGRRFFSDAFALDDVMAGTVQSTQRCYQFHE